MPDPDETDVADALLAAEVFHLQIVNADTKAGFLIAAVSVLLGAVTNQRDVLPPHGVSEWIGVGMLAASVLAGLYAALQCARVLSPRVARTRFSRFSWPSVARAEVADLLRLDPADRRREAWTTARALAGIAETKFRLFRLGLRSFLVAAALLVPALTVLAL